MSWDADGNRRSPEEGFDAVFDRAPEKCVSGVIDVMYFIFLIIPHSVETQEKWLCGCTSLLNVCVCVCSVKAALTTHQGSSPWVTQPTWLRESRWWFGYSGALVHCDQCVTMVLLGHSVFQNSLSVWWHPLLNQKNRNHPSRSEVLICFVQQTGEMSDWVRVCTVLVARYHSVPYVSV